MIARVLSPGRGAVPKVSCADCGHQWLSKASTEGPRRCRACTKRSKQARLDSRPGRGGVREAAASYGATLERVGVRELKANPGELLSLLERSPEMEIIITRYGKAAAKLVSVTGKPGQVPWEHRSSLRGSWSQMPDLTDQNFAEAKGIWEPKLDA